MGAVSGADPTLATQCLEICQALVTKGVAFSLSMTVGSTITFTLDTREKEVPSSTPARKKLSPSNLRRNKRRKEEFLQRKAEIDPEPVEKTGEKPAAECSWRSEVEVSDTKSVKIKLKKNPPKTIAQLDGHEEEVTTDAAVQTDVKTEFKDAGVQTTKAKEEPPPIYVPPRRRRREERGGEEREEDRRPWYEKIDEYYDELEREKREKEKT